MIRSCSTVVLLATLILATTACGPRTGDSEAVSLRGRVQSSQGEPLGGVPLDARLPGSNVSFVVYTNKQGMYSYSRLSPGAYTVSIQVPGFQHVSKEGVAVTEGDPAVLDFALEEITPPLEALTTAEVLMSLPGDQRQKTEASRCSNCHSLQFALERKKDRATWLQTIE